MKLFSKKAFFTILILLAALCVCACASAASGGTCGADGDNLTWTLDDNGLLTIYGTGEMKGYSTYSQSPWGTGITEVRIENGATSIGKYAFYMCANLVKVTIPDGVGKIGQYAFQGCSGLSSITIPGSVTEIEGNAFTQCTGLSSITIPGTVKTLGQDVFRECSGLKNVTIRDGITEIPNGTFRGCSGLEEIVIPPSVKSIVGAAFGDCTSLVSVEIQNKDIRFDFRDSFFGCTKMTRLILPKDHTVYTIKDNVLFSKDETMLLYCPRGRSGSYTVPDGTIGIMRYAFYGCENLTKVSCPESVTEIGYMSFQYCENLSEISFSRSLRCVWAYAFYDCPSIKEFTLYDKLDNIDICSFLHGPLYHVAEGSYAEYWAQKYEYRYDTFKQEHYVTVTTNGNGKAFATPAAAPAGTEITLTAEPDSGYTLGSWEVIRGQVSISDNKFEMITEDVEIKACFVPVSPAENQVTVNGCVYKLNHENMTATLASVTNKQLKKLVIPAAVSGEWKDAREYRVTEIAPGVCKGLKKLAGVTIGANVKSIGKGAFQKCTALKKITIPAGVTKIGANAFNGCKALKTIDLKKTNLTKEGIGKNCFKGIADKATFKCPKALKKDYKTWILKTGKAPKSAKFK